MSLNEVVYRVGDHVYVEDVAAEPYQIRRIEELVKTSSGTVDAKLSCFYRRAEISSSLIDFADENLSALVEEDNLTEEQMKNLADRELFSSNMIETVTANVIRGKCSVIRVSDVESAYSYLGKEDLFFYCYMYEPSVRTLMCDDGEIRVGAEYQVKEAVLGAKGKLGAKKRKKGEVMMWDPNNELTDQQVDEYLGKAVEIGTYARALDGRSRIQNESLLMSATSATRDASKFHALDVLHERKYQVPDAIRSLMPSDHAVVVRDELELWTPRESLLFREGIKKIGKDFWAIRQDLLPWKSVRSLVEYYYMWKTTDAYDKSVKTADAKRRLVKIAAPPPDAYLPPRDDAVAPRVCPNCQTLATYVRFVILPYKKDEVCHSCWDHWKRYAVVKPSSPVELK